MAAKSRGTRTARSGTRTKTASSMWLTLVLLTALARSAESLRVVALLGGPESAHRSWIRPLLAELRAQKVDVHVVEVKLGQAASPGPHGGQGALGLAVMQERFAWRYRNASLFQRVRDLHQLGRALSHQQLLHAEELRRRLDALRPADVLLVDYYLNDAILGAARRLGSPAVVVLSPLASVPPSVDRLIANPPIPAVTPHMVQGTAGPLSFSERLWSTALRVQDDLVYRWQHADEQRRLAAEAWGPLVGRDDQQGDDVTLVLANVVEGLDDSTPKIPRLLHVGGLDASDNRAISQELSKLLAADVESLVLVSVPPRAERVLDVVLDDLERPSRRGQSVLLFLHHHASIQEVLRKRPKLASNVHLVDPDHRPSDVLRNAAGRLLAAVWVGCVHTAQSALLRGVPQVAVPLSLDEQVLAAQLESQGVARVLDAALLDGKVLGDALETMGPLAATARTVSRGLCVEEDPAECALRVAVRAVRAAPALAKGRGGRPPPLPALPRLLLLDVLPALGLLASAAAAALAAFCALLLTLLCYRKRYAPKRKYN